MVRILFRRKTLVILDIETVTVFITRTGEVTVFRGLSGPPENVKVDVPEDWEATQVADAFLDFLDAYASGDCEGGSAKFCEVFGPAWEQVLRSYDDLREIFPER